MIVKPIRMLMVNQHEYRFKGHLCNCINNKKHLKNVGPIRHCEPLHCHSPGVATVARRLRIDVYNDDDNNDDDNA